MISFCESYVRFRQAGYDATTARRLALGDQAPALGELWREDESGVGTAAAKDHLARLQRMKQSGRGQRFRTKSGVRVRSKAEKIIADFLFDQGLAFEYEPILDLAGFYVLPDFHLLDYGVYLEHFGMDSPEYKRSAEAKLARYREFGLPLVCTYASDEPDIEEVLTRKLRELGVPVGMAPGAAEAFGQENVAAILRLMMVAESNPHDGTDATRPVTLSGLIRASQRG